MPLISDVTLTFPKAEFEIAVPFVFPIGFAAVPLLLTRKFACPAWLWRAMMPSALKGSVAVAVRVLPEMEMTSVALPGVPKVTAGAVPTCPPCAWMPAPCQPFWTVLLSRWARVTLADVTFPPRAIRPIADPSECGPPLLAVSVFPEMLTSVSSPAQLKISTPW